MASRRWYTYDSRDSARGTEGINEGWWVEHRSYGRENSDESPYLLSNEWICSNIGRLLGLPIPPFALMRRHGKGMFVSWMYGSGSVTPDDVLPDVCFQQMPEVCTGILLFDVFVANPDRHRGNLKVDDPHRPTRVEVIDHDRSMFGSSPGQGAARLERLWDRLGTSGGSQTAETENCLMEVASSSDYFETWLQKIMTIPDWFLDDVCEEAMGIPATRDEVDVAKAFLKDRKRRLRELLKGHKNQFPGIRQWRLLP